VDTSPAAGYGVQAEVIAGDRHLRLFSEVSTLGFAASVFDAHLERFVGQTTADNMEDAKNTAELLARAYLKAAGILEIPPVYWETNPQRRQR